jgi:hypothetical protein
MSSSKRRPAAEDDALLELITSATSSMACRQSRYWLTPVRPRPEFGTGLTVLAIVVVLGGSLLATGLQLKTNRTQPAFLQDAANFIRMPLTSDGADGGHFFVAAVRDPDRPESRLDRPDPNIRSAQRNAARAALNCVGRSGVDISFRSMGSHGGSGGLMFGITLVDALGPTDLARGRRIAGTGTITSAGIVGPILEIHLKAQAAERAGADVFLAPTSQAREAKRSVRALRVVAVRTLDDAVRALDGGKGCSHAAELP